MLNFFCYFSLLSSSRDSTYRDDNDMRSVDDLNGMSGKIAKSSSCSSFLIDILFRGIFKKQCHSSKCVASVCFFLMFVPNSNVISARTINNDPP